MNSKRRQDEPSGKRPPPPASGLPSRVPVQWLNSERPGDWTKDWEEVELDGEAVLSELPEEIVSALPEEVEEDADAWDREQVEGEEAEGREEKTEAAPAPDAESDDAGDEDDDDKRRGRRRSKTIARKQMLRERRRMLAQGTIPEIVDYDRPRARSDCRDAKRPCLYVSCRYHLYLDVNPVTGSIKLNFPDKEVWELEETCALDVAERGGITLEEVGEIMNLTRERIRQVEVSGLEKLKAGDAALHTFIDGHELDVGPTLPVGQSPAGRSPTGRGATARGSKGRGSKSLPVVDD